MYRRIGEETRGVYAAFLLIALLTAAVLSLVAASTTGRGLQAIAAAWTRLPEFSVSSGKVVLPQNVSLPVRVVADGAVIVLTQRATSGSNPLGAAPVGLLLTGSELLLRTESPPLLAGSSDRAVPLSALNGYPLDKSSLGQLLSFLASTGVWFGAAAAIVYDLARDLLRALIIAWIGLTATRLAGRDPGWPQAWRVGLAAWTLPMLAEAAQVAVPIPGWALWLVACVYAISGCLVLTPVLRDR